uniref:Uncharacterized protein n=1 Tax=Opuntia streptacantha TaxID=393608 RepID=A0A7C8ZRL7_OPUST
MPEAMNFPVVKSLKMHCSPSKYTVTPPSVKEMTDNRGSSRPGTHTTPLSTSPGQIVTSPATRPVRILPSLCRSEKQSGRSLLFSNPDSSGDRCLGAPESTRHSTPEANNSIQRKPQTERARKDKKRKKGERCESFGLRHSQIQSTIVCIDMTPEAEKRGEGTNHRAHNLSYMDSLLKIIWTKLACHSL